MAEALADELGVELEIVKMSWDGLIPGVQSGSSSCDVWSSRLKMSVSSVGVVVSGGGVIGSRGSE